MQGDIERAWAMNWGFCILSVAVVWALVTLSRLLSLLWISLAPRGKGLSVKLGGLSLGDILGPL